MSEIQQPMTHESGYSLSGQSTGKLCLILLLVFTVIMQKGDFLGEKDTF